METTGRNAGWLAASTSLVKSTHPKLAPHIILLPEKVFNEQKLTNVVDTSIKKMVSVLSLHLKVS